MLHQDSPIHNPLHFSWFTEAGPDLAKAISSAGAGGTCLEERGESWCSLNTGFVQGETVKAESRTRNFLFACFLLWVVSRIALEQVHHGPSCFHPALHLALVLLIAGPLQA